jgi:hypothetical protein
LPFTQKKSHRNVCGGSKGEGDAKSLVHNASDRPENISAHIGVVKQRQQTIEVEASTEAREPSSAVQ